MKLQIIEQTKEFVKDAFKKNPHYSFNHWSIMYDHSVRTQELALKIADKITCDKTIVSICALLHDIGKTHKIDVKILHKDHQNFNLIVSEEFLKSLNLNNNDFKKVCDIIRYESDSTEMKIVKDADALALYFDKKLYMLWIAWVFENGLEYEIARKLGKFDKLYFEISKRIGKSKLEEMKQDFSKYAQSIGKTI